MKKEKVVVFDGEDKFINPKNKMYDKTTGKSEFVGFNTEDKPNPEYEEFKRYIQNQQGDVVVPSPSDTNFCTDVKVFLDTRGQGRANPEQLMEAYNLFRQYCIEKPADTPPYTPPGKNPASVSINDIEFPQWLSLDCATLATELDKLRTMGEQITDLETRTAIKAEIKRGEAVQSAKCTSPGQDTPPASDTPPKDTPPASTPPGDSKPPSTGSGSVSTSPPAFVPLNVPTLGKPPASGLSGGASGGGEEKEKEAKKPNWLLWVIIGGIVLYFATKKKSE